MSSQICRFKKTINCVNLAIYELSAVTVISGNLVEAYDPRSHSKSRDSNVASHCHQIESKLLHFAHALRQLI